jgi:hypothetical protein
MPFEFFERPSDPRDRQPACGAFWLHRDGLLGRERLDILPDPDRPNFALVIHTPSLAAMPVTTWIAPLLVVDSLPITAETLDGLWRHYTFCRQVA